MSANGKPSGRFELPALTPVTFSLTEGTDIPPPPDSPIEEKSEVPAPILSPADIKPINTSTTPAKRSASPDAPLSPTLSSRPSSIRRFLSRKSLHTNYMNGTNGTSKEDLATTARPNSPGSLFNGRSSVPKKKKSGGWFKRLGSSDNSAKRASVIYDTPPVLKTVPVGPPPPKLPELNQLKAKIPEDDEGSLGGEDMFKNIQ